MNKHTSVSHILSSGVLNHAYAEFVEVPCILCGQNETRLIANKGKFGLPIYVSICVNDGLIYLNPRWTKTRYQQFYSKEYDKYYRSHVLSGESDESKYAKINQIWNRLQRYGHSFSSVLDIGSGMGWSLDFIAKKLDCRVSIAAIEASEHCVQHIIHGIGAELLAQDVDSDWHKGSEGRFDLIIMRHVLEHFLDPIEVLRKVSKVLSPKGIAYIAVPDAMSPRGSLDGSWFRVVHTYYFSEETLVCAAARANLQPIMVQSEHSELWGLFTRARVEYDSKFHSVYERQIKIIEAYRRKRFVKELVTYLPLRLSLLMPASLKDRVPETIKKVLKMKLY